ncbi:hypothetical protein HOY82DRAFT_589627 [Tuber indicum]|nr:hypothetical protein HOY82DRAFT_589627 [Tuber indicum]
MVNQQIPTALRIDRGQLKPPLLAPPVSPAPNELNRFLALFSDNNFTAARVAGRVAALGAWTEPDIQDLDNEHQFEGNAPWGIDSNRPYHSLWKLYCESLSRRYPNRYPLVISNPILLDDLPTTFLTREIHQRLPQCSNLLFILRNNSHEYWFGDLNLNTATLHILAPWPTGAVAIPDILSSHGALEQCLRVATRDPVCRIAHTQGYNISTAPGTIDRSWRYALRALALWHETSNPDGFWPRRATTIDSAGWDMPGFMGGLLEILHQQQNENPEDPTQELESEAIADMPYDFAQSLFALTYHIKAIEFAQREFDNGAEAILFRSIPSNINDECGPAGGGPCAVRLTALRRSQKHIFLG